MSFLNNGEALGLPKGTVRALLALILVGAFIAAVFVGVSDEGLVALSAMASSAVTFYFTKRANEPN